MTTRVEPRRSNTGADRLVIDRLVLTDLGIAAGRAERIRVLVAEELTRALLGEGWPERRGLATLRRIVGTTIDLPAPLGDHQLAVAVAEGLAHAVARSGRPEDQGSGDGGL